MKVNRQAKILEIICSADIETQEQLLEKLRAAGYNSTQATVSRDIKEMRLVKEMTSEGNYRYAESSRDNSGAFAGRLRTIFRESVTSFDYAQNIVVIKTLPGLASAACSALDSMRSPLIVGTLAGDDTGILVMRNEASAISFCNEIKKMIY